MAAVSDRSLAPQARPGRHALSAAPVEATLWLASAAYVVGAAVRPGAFDAKAVIALLALLLLSVLILRGRRSAP